MNTRSLERQRGKKIQKLARKSMNKLDYHGQQIVMGVIEAYGDIVLCNMAISKQKNDIQTPTTADKFLNLSRKALAEMIVIAKHHGDAYEHLINHVNMDEAELEMISTELQNVTTVEDASIESTH